MKRNVSDDQTPLTKAVAEAISSGNPMPLYAFLGRASHLPGPRANLDLARIFADMCTMHGSKGEKLATKMASLDADEAPGNTELEFLPVWCARRSRLCDHQRTLPTRHARRAARSRRRPPLSRA